MSDAADWDAIVASTPSGRSDDWDSIVKSIPASPKEGSKAGLGSDIQNAFAGAGREIVKLNRGAQQLWDIPSVWLEKRLPGLSEWSQTKLGMPSAESIAARTNAEEAESRTLDAPLMNTKAGMAGSIVSNIATTMLPVGAAAQTGSLAARALLNPTTYKAAATSGAIQGGLQPTTEDESRLANVGIGAGAGMVGNLAANTLGRIAQPVANILSSAHEKSVQVLEKAGINLDAAQKTGSSFLNKLRSSFWDNPVTSGAQSELSQAQRSGYNKAVLKTIGEDASAATPEVMGAAEKRINGVFKDVLDRNNVSLTDPIITKIHGIKAAANEEEKKPVASIASRIIDSIGNDGKISGQVAYGIKKDLDRIASSSDSGLAYHARQLRSTLMDAINGSLSQEDSQAFGQARMQFGNMKKIEGTIDRLGNGDISPSKLANVMAQKANRGTSIYGKGEQDLADLAHAGNMLLPDRNQNSGTTSRFITSTILPGLVAGGAEGAYSGDPEKAATAALAGAALPKAAQKLMNNPAVSAYLKKGMTGPMTPLRNMLLSPQTNSTVGGMLRRIPPAYEGIERQKNQGR
jgi:hypothetical protein